jgi:hypothetical protein
VKNKVFAVTFASKIATKRLRGLASISSMNFAAVACVFRSRKRSPAVKLSSDVSDAEQPAEITTAQAMSKRKMTCAAVNEAQLFQKKGDTNRA